MLRSGSTRGVLFWVAFGALALLAGCSGGADISATPATTQFPGSTTELTEPTAVPQVSSVPTAPSDPVISEGDAQEHIDAAAEAHATVGAAAVDAARAEAEALRLVAIEAQIDEILVDYPSVAAEVVGDVVVLTGTVRTPIAKATLDATVRATGLGIQNNVVIDDSSEYSLIDLIEAQPELSTLGSLVELAGLGATLTDTSPITLFAPTNDAFVAMGPSLGEIRADPVRLRAFLLSHIVAVNSTLTELTQQPYESLTDGSAVIVAGTASGFVVNDLAPVLIEDIRAANGFMHIVARPIVAD